MSPIRSVLPAIDTSAYLGLARIDMLGLLPQLWGRIAMPHAVCKELTVDHRNREPDPRTLPWVELVAPLPHPALDGYVLGAGESAVLSFALYRDDALAIFDETRGKKVARAHGLGARLTGTLGVLLRAKEVEPRCWLP